MELFTKLMRYPSDLTNTNKEGLLKSSSENLLGLLEVVESVLHHDS